MKNTINSAYQNAYSGAIFLWKRTLQRKGVHINIINKASYDTHYKNRSFTYLYDYANPEKDYAQMIARAKRKNKRVKLLKHQQFEGLLLSLGIEMPKITLFKKWFLSLPMRIAYKIASKIGCKDLSLNIEVLYEKITQKLNINPIQ